MKESYSKGVANHADPESCLDDPRGRGEALTRERTGGLWSSEITIFQTPTSWCEREGNMNSSVKSRATVRSGGVRELGMCGNSIHENRETSEAVTRLKQMRTAQDVPEKVKCHNTGKAAEESDSNIVPEKQTNKATSVAAETVEGRKLTKRNAKKETVSRT